MFNFARQKFETILVSLLNKKIKIKSSTLLQGYTTFMTIQQHTGTLPVTRDDLKKWNGNHKYGLLKIDLPSTTDTRNAFDAFTSVSIYEFLRFIVPDLVAEPQKLLEQFNRIHGTDLVLLCHYILSIKFFAYQHAEIKLKSSNDSYEKKLYEAYCKENNDLNLSQEEFTSYFAAINLYQLDVNEYSITTIGYEEKELYQVADTLSSRLMLSREQQFDMLYRFYVKNETDKAISERYFPYQFAGIKDPKEREREILKLMKLLAKIPPLDALSLVSIHKKNMGQSSESSAIRNDITLENGLIYSLFTSRVLLRKSLEEDILIFNPSLFFVKKWISDPKTKNKKVTFVFQALTISETVTFHYQEGSYAHNPDNQIISFMSYDQWKAQTRSLSSKKKCLSHTIILLFACGMRQSAQKAWYQFIKENVSGSVEIFSLISSYEFEQAQSPFSSELDDPHMNIASVEIIPQGINNSTSPRRKLFIHCIYDAVNPMSGPTEVSAYTLNTDFKVQALSRMFEEPIQLAQQDLVGLYRSVRKLYQQELLARRAIGRKNVAAISHEFTPDITIWCSKTYPPNNKNRPRLEAYVCSIAGTEQIENGFRGRGEAIEKTKKHTVKIQDENISNWLEQVYPFSVVQARHTSKEKSEIEGPYLLKPAINIREQIIESYTPHLSGKNIALKTLWYLYPELEDLYSSRDYAIFSQMACSEIGFLRVGDMTPEICEDMFITCFPNDSREELLRKISILSTALSKAVDYSYCKTNLLYESVHDQKFRNRLFNQVRKALTKKHFTQDELRNAFCFVAEKIRTCELEYLGVMIRLLTGLDSNTVCGLKWKDIKEISDYEISKIVVTRQVTNDGNEVKGFGSLEDYLCFPCSHLLKKFLENHFAEVQRLLPAFADFEECFIVNSKAALLNSKKRYKAFPPRDLEKLCRETISVVGIEDHIVEIPDKDNGTKETNLNRYHGDFFRENFRYWALNCSKLTPDEVLYLLGNKPETTFGVYYCDFLNDASQLMIFVKLLRLDAVFDSSGNHYAENIKLSEIQSLNREFLPIRNQPLKIHIRLTLHNEGRIELQAKSKYGMSAYFAPIAPTTQTEESNV